MNSKTLIASSLLALGATLPLSAQDDVKFNVPGATPPAAEAQPAPAQEYSEAQLLEMFGWLLGRRAGLPELEFTQEETEAIVRGLRIAAAGDDAPQDLQAVGPAMEQFMRQKETTFRNKLREQGLAESQAFLSQIRQKEGVVSTPSGLAYEIIEQGSGPKPQPSDTVRVHYTGTLVNGTVFDSSRESGQPAEFQLDRVIPGWTEGLQQVQEGGKIRLYVPPQLAYGDSGVPGIPPSSTLIFEVELLAVNPPAAAPEATPDATQKK